MFLSLIGAGLIIASLIQVLFISKIALSLNLEKIFVATLLVVPLLILSRNLKRY